MSDKSERAYWWIYSRANRLGKWIDSNRGRILIIAMFTWLAIWGFLLEGQDNLSTWQRLIRSLGPSLAGIVIAAVTIEALAERRIKQERKAQLIRQMGSRYRDVTEMAIIELRHKGWLEDGSLSGAYLRQANLSGADLGGADLSGADLRGADLSGAQLWQANLSGAKLDLANLSGDDLTRANLSRAGLWRANLTRADLEWANLSGAWLSETTLSGAHLQGTDLSGAHLQGADLSGAYLAESTLTMRIRALANLSGANLTGANLSGVYLWTITQLEQARTLVGAIMPDGVQLGQEETGDREDEEYLEYIEGPIFEEWKAQYLAEQETNDEGYR